MNKIINKDFNKIITDLIKDLALVFPDIIEKNENNDIINILNYIKYKISIENEDETYVTENPDFQLIEDYNTSCKNLLLHCLETFPKIFFEILYKNEDLFKIVNNETANDETANDETTNDETTNDETINKEYDTFLLPNIDFKILFNDKDISEKTRETLWNYLQIVLFSIISNIESENSFGDAAKLFEAFDNEKLFEKFSNVFDNIKNMYNDADSNNTDSNDISENNIFNKFKNMADLSFTNLPEIGETYDHLKSVLNGKIGKLAMEFGEELYNELDLKDLENSGVQNINDVYKNLFKNPGKNIQSN